MTQLALSLTTFLFGFSVFASIGHDRIAELKNEIIAISKQNTTNEAEFEITRQKLEVLIAELKKISNPVDQTVVSQFLSGSWKQIWSDEKNMDVTGGPQRDLNEIYQYVNPAGWVFNFGVRTLPNGQKITFALRVQASVNGIEQTTEITAAFLRMTPLSPSESIAQISQQIFDGKSLDFIERDAGRFPKGPIGAVGILTLQYLDDDLKIGTTNNVFTGKNEMFVLERIER